MALEVRCGTAVVSRVASASAQELLPGFLAVSGEGGGGETVGSAAAVSTPLRCRSEVLVPRVGGAAAAYDGAVAALASTRARFVAGRQVLAPGDSGSGPAAADLPKGAAGVVELRAVLDADGGPAAAPCLRYEPLAGGEADVGEARLELDVLCYAPEGTSAAAACAEVQRKLVDQAQLSIEALGRAAKAAGTRAYHFAPPQLGHAVTVVYPVPADGGDIDLPLRETRLELHRRLGLPEDRPMLRTTSALKFEAPAAAGANERIRDVHTLGIPPSGVAGGVQTCVKGSYDYHHYMQDRFDDKGWGCAYRSAQTIFSWFRLQHYTKVPVPSHRDMQQTLVRIGDKEAKFVGSCQWIGANEVGYLLDELIGVQYRIMHYSSGYDIPGGARDLIKHFETHGTPIMMGGGLLAYTMLGVDFNEHTGEVAFLILDPHYTGGEDFAQIKGRWCGWKRAEDFLDQNSFYNLCAPQLPRDV